jgi:hypothetical protein
MKTVNTLVITALVVQGSMAFAVTPSQNVGAIYKGKAVSGQTQIQQKAAAAQGNAATITNSNSRLERITDGKPAPKAAPVKQAATEDTTNDRLVDQAVQNLEVEARTADSAEAREALETVVDIVKHPAAHEVKGNALTKIKVVATELSDVFKAERKKNGTIKATLRLVEATLAKFNIKRKSLVEDCGA